MGRPFVQRFLPAPRTCPGGLEIFLEMVKIKNSSRQTVGVCWMWYDTVRLEDLAVVFVFGGATVVWPRIPPLLILNDPLVTHSTSSSRIH
jgi:hypothetical protein